MPLSGIIVLIAIASGLYYVCSYAKLSEKKNALETAIDFNNTMYKHALWRMRFAYLHKGKDLPFQFEDAALEWANRILGDYKPDPKTLNECTAELSKQREESKA